MGKQSKRATKKYCPTDLVKENITAEDAEDEEMIGGPWSMLPWFDTYKDVKAEAARALDVLRDSSTPVNSVGEWRVYIRRANMWFEMGKTKKKRTSSKYRCWLVSFILVHWTPEGVGSNMVSCMAHDHKAMANDASNSPITPNLFLASLCLAMEKFKSKPSGLLFWPALNGAFRARSMQSLVEQLKPMVANDYSLKCMALVQPDREDMSDSCTKICLSDRNNPEGIMFTRGNSAIARLLESRLVGAEDRLNKSMEYVRSDFVPCLTHNLELSIANLRVLFRASALYHDARPWELISNFKPLTIRVPDLVGGGPAKTWYVIVAGNGSWDGRGLYFYKSWNDLLISGSRERRRGRKLDQTVLQYFNRTQTPFQTLTHIEELGLDISTNDGADGETTYPCWFWTTTFGSDICDTNPAFTRTYHNTPPKLEDIPSLALATMVVAKFVTDPRRLIYADEDERGRPITAIPVGEVPILLDLSEEGKGIVVATLECRQIRPGDFQADMKTYMETMSIGDMTMCNFCQKPNYLIKRDGEQLNACSRCTKVEYCSKQCQCSDWKRHKKECCSVKK
jgi:hypothetical protein